MLEKSDSPVVGLESTGQITEPEVYFMCFFRQMALSSASSCKYLGLFTALTILLLAVWYGSNHSSPGRKDEVLFDVPTVLNGLLAAESEAVVRPGVQVAIGFGGCLDRLANGISVLEYLGARPPELAENINELNSLPELEAAFAYFFRNGASAG
jgi:ADP-specific Phosphofructokinase/Glucokinase conserved region